MVRRVLIPAVAAGALALGCGGSDDRASARSTPAPSPVPEGRPVDVPATPAKPAGRPGLRLRRIGSFDSPLYVTAPPGDRRRVFVVEQGGRVRIFQRGRIRRRPFLDISGRVQAGGEQGLLSLAFAPDYQRSGRFYVFYTDTSGHTRVVEYRRASRHRADHGSARLVLFQRDSESNHNGGLLLFGPDDLLYVGLGDGGGAGDQHGSRGNGQNLGTLLGKVLRIDPRAQAGDRYRVPRANPFVGRAGARGEIFAYGLRNPWRFSFHPRTGDLIVGDVGQGAVEEITIVRRKGANLGWRPFEGRRRYAAGESAPGHVPPAIERFHSDGNCSITGGIVVRNPFLSALDGRYVFGDFCRGRIESARIRGGRARDERATRLQVDQLSSFGEDGRGRVYATSLAGPVYRLVPR